MPGKLNGRSDAKAGCARAGEGERNWDSDVSDSSIGGVREGDEHGRAFTCTLTLSKICCESSLLSIPLCAKLLAQQLVRRVGGREGGAQGCCAGLMVDVGHP